MPDLQQFLEERFITSLSTAFGPAFAQADPMIGPSINTKFGDYQANVAMRLAKQLKRKPREVAEAIVDKLELDQVCDRIEIAGPGFINVRLSSTFLSERVAAMATDPCLGIAPADSPEKVIVDYSCPNLAKEMHVGHLRSTIIGDAIVRVLEFQGHHVIRQNHVGDWGTQFGMLACHLDDNQPATQADMPTEELSIPDIEAFYQQAKRRFDTDTKFADRSRDCVVQLQRGDEHVLQMWRAIREQSLAHCQLLYERLGVKLKPDDVRGESAYNDMLPTILEDLKKAQLLRTSQNADVVFPAGFKDRDGNPLPVIVRKSDGGYLYATTDLAAARYRIEKLNTRRVIYVTDARQIQHFAMVFQTLREAGWATDTVRLDHVAFGSILGKDHRPFKTREGGTVKLSDVIDEAEERAARILEQKNPDSPDENRRRIAQAVGIGAIKYADLSNDRMKDYIFDWDRMLALDGNTAPYLLNAYVRIRSIFRKGNVDEGMLANQAITIKAAEERALALKLLQFPVVITAVADNLEPHRLCTFLYDVATAFHRFYEACPVLRAENKTTGDSRLRLCDLTARCLRTGLDLLGIRAIEKM